MLFYYFVLNIKFYNNIIPPSTIFLTRIINSKEYIIHKVSPDLFPLNMMNRSCLIILELLKLSYCNRACKSSIKNSLKQILITEIKPLSLQKKKLNDLLLIKIDLIKFHLIESCQMETDTTTKNLSFNSQRNDIFSNICNVHLELFFAFSRERIDKRMA